MSEFSLILRKYDSVSGLTESLNRSVLALKKRHISREPGVARKYPEILVNDDEVNAARQEIIRALFSLDEFINKKNSENILYELMGNDLFRQQILADDHYKELVRQVAEKLKADTELDTDEFGVLDKFISILDNESTILFRKLRNHRS